jgi:hypothetical protein
MENSVVNQEIGYVCEGLPHKDCTRFCKMQAFGEINFVGRKVSILKAME